MSLLVYETEPKMQKKRFFRTPKSGKLKFGEYGFLILKEGQIEPIQISLLKKLLKKLVKKERRHSLSIPVFRERIWLNIFPNFYLHSKSKNSRMGKGKGLVERKVIRVRRNTILTEFLGIPYWRLLLAAKKINKKLSIKLKVIGKESILYHLWSNPTRYKLYYNKYLL